MKKLDFVLIVIFVVIGAVFVTGWPGCPFFEPPFHEGDLVTPKKDVTLNWAPPGVNDLLGIAENDQPVFHEEEVGVIERGGDLNDFVHRDPLFVWQWWCRVNVGRFALWCKCDDLKLHSNE
jgi:hypothetical protein